LHTREYEALCQAAFGRFLDREPEPEIGPSNATAKESTRLRATLDRAQRDEGISGNQLPLLFRIDRELDVSSGRRYLVDCGGRGECFGVAGVVCLQHLRGVDKPTTGPWGGGLSRRPAVGDPTAGGGSG